MFLNSHHLYQAHSFANDEGFLESIKVCTRLPEETVKTTFSPLLEINGKYLPDTSEHDVVARFRLGEVSDGKYQVISTCFTLPRDLQRQSSVMEVNLELFDLGCVDVHGSLLRMVDTCFRFHDMFQPVIKYAKNSEQWEIRSLSGVVLSECSLMVRNGKAWVKGLLCSEPRMSLSRGTFKNSSHVD